MASYRQFCVLRSFRTQSAKARPDHADIREICGSCKETPRYELFLFLALWRPSHDGGTPQQDEEAHQYAVDTADEWRIAT
jgi:hypothetical protein